MCYDGKGVAKGHKACRYTLPEREIENFGAYFRVVVVKVHPKARTRKFGGLI